jgi:putative ATPase
MLPLFIVPSAGPGPSTTAVNSDPAESRTNHESGTDRIADKRVGKVASHVLSMSTRVPCPICQANVANERINDHIDSGCKSYSGAPTPKRLKVSPPSSFKPNKENFKSPSTYLEAVNDVKGFDFKKADFKAVEMNVVPVPPKSKKPFVPLAELARPTTWDQYKGQGLSSGDSMLKALSSNERLPSCILWGT